MYVNLVKSKMLFLNHNPLTFSTAYLREDQDISPFQKKNNNMTDIRQ